MDFYGNMPPATSVYNAGIGYNHDTPNQPTVDWDINTNNNNNGCNSTNACLQTSNTAGAYNYLSGLTTTGTPGLSSIYLGKHFKRYGVLRLH